MLILVKITAGGLVQGVGFRYFVKTTADDYGIKGYVKNIYSGEVEIEAEGEEDIIKKFVKEIKRGPTFSQVRSFYIDHLEYKNKYSKFEIFL